jgi:hypothetical protein
MLAAWAAVVVLAARHILDAWGRIGPAAVPVTATAVATALLLAARGTDVLGWHGLLRGAGAGTPLHTSSRVYLTSELVRYLPGGVLHFAARYRYATRLGVTPTTVVATTTIDLALRLVTGLVVFALSIPLFPELPRGASALTVAAIPALLAGTHPRVLARLLAAAQRRLRHVETPLVLPYRTLLRASGWYLAGWLARGAVTWLVVRALVTVDGSAWIPLAGATGLSWVIGVITPVAPGGIGAREAAGVALLRPWLPLDLGLVVMLIVRLATTVAELVAAGLAVAVDRWATRATRADRAVRITEREPERAPVRPRRGAVAAPRERSPR